MKHNLCFFVIFAVAYGILACSPSAKDMFDPELVDEYNTNKNGAGIFGAIDPNQDWNSITTGHIEITADADLSDIAKVQVLTESPFFNNECRILNEKDVRKGQTVTLSYDVPSIYKKLVAACVTNKGVYYIKYFNVGQKSVNFKSSLTRASSRREAAAEVALENLVLEKKNVKQSFNAQRTILANEAAQSDDSSKKQYVSEKHLDIWENSGWEHELMWKVTKKGSSSTSPWVIDDGFIYRNIDPMGADENELLTNIYNVSLFKTEAGKKKNNLELLRNNANFQLAQNYITCDGVNPLTVIPVQINSTEAAMDYLYYYYYNPIDIVGMNSEEQAAYFKQLPKFLAVNCGTARKEANKQSTDLAAFTKCQEYLLPYFGDGQPTDGQTAVSTIIPQGYKVGFLIRKFANSNVDEVRNGCTYGDGRLNKQINHFPGHFGSSMTANGYTMREDDPRNVIFNVNGNTYISFEDGADCNFCDLIIQVSNGANSLEDPQEPEAASYTMCFEDRPLTADYDMNDVVLHVNRVNSTHIQVSLAACGAVDRVVLHGVTGSRMLDGREIHEIFGLDSNQYYVNTQSNGLHLDPLSEIVTVSENLSINDYLKNIYIENVSNGNSIIGLPKKGYAPFAIIIPIDFNYPQEGICIKDAYLNFTNWAQNVNNNKDWFLSEQGGKVYISPLKNK